MLTSTKFLEEFNQHFLIKPSQKKKTLAGFVAQHVWFWVHESFHGGSDIILAAAVIIYLQWHFTLHTMYKLLQITISLNYIAHSLSSCHSRCYNSLQMPNSLSRCQIKCYNSLYICLSHSAADLCIHPWWSSNMHLNAKGLGLDLNLCRAHQSTSASVHNWCHA